MRKLASSFFMALLGALTALGLFSVFSGDTGIEPINKAYAAKPFTTISVPAIDFTVVAERTTPAVVHIKTKVFAGKSNSRVWGDEFWGSTPDAKDYSSGSGVIIDADGYIVTNRHVIESSDQIEVILNDKRTFMAKLISADPSTDLAVLKISAKNLPYIPYANSDNVRVGEWVMAVGNPFNLASTVTTGIVSAKARNINILKNNLAIESFIQTDAAVNPGNSGGALVSFKGELIGINTAIATPTGYFAGYSFAVPVNIVKKVVDDMIQYGKVRRGFLGVSIRDVDASLAERLGLTRIKGVYVSNVNSGSGADVGGVSQGDVILKVAGIEVNSAPELQEVVSRYSPNDKLEIVVNRKGNTKRLSVMLKGDF